MGAMRVERIGQHITPAMEGIAKFKALQIEVLRQLPKLQSASKSKFVHEDRLGTSPLQGDILGQVSAKLEA